ncbi:MAG TPA: hypothetical protein ENG33_01135, partial [Chloroflexi bacterium]|nr:hypothetical protein [Chloroflexota bacterium]
MSYLLGEGYGLGFHKYNPAEFPGVVFLDVSDAQYNPLNPEEVIVGIHPAKKPGAYGIAKFRDGALVAEAITPYKWSASFELYIDAEERLLYA